MMSRKDYVSVADILLENSSAISAEAFEDIVKDFSDFFLKDNKNFSPIRFENACYNLQNA